MLGIDADTLTAMTAYSWPSNVRELANAIEGAFTFGRSATIGLADLPAAVSGHAPRGWRSRPARTYSHSLMPSAT